MSGMHIEIANEAATIGLAHALAGQLRPGDCVLLSGPYGAGKSFFARAVIRALIGDPQHEVPSPSFSLLQTYATALGPLHHFDLWRLSGSSEITEIGLWDALSDITLIEWPELSKPRPNLPVHRTKST